jgi:ankyrin repeat protein
MRHAPSRRRFLQLASIALPVAAASSRSARAIAASPSITALYPTQPPELVQEMVLVAHTNLVRVKELVGRQATLAKATWDWGFGDWETALGAASHIGNREIAEVLLQHGAHPTMFSAAMLGHLDVVKAFVTASPGIQRTRGPHSISLMSHATAGGPPAAAVVEYLKSIEGADASPAVQPLTEADLAKLSGSYAFGVMLSDRIEITASRNQLQIGRPAHYPRGLFHLGSYEFCPVGAENVRVTFAESAGAMTLTVHDPDIVLTARKVS